MRGKRCVLCSSGALLGITPAHAGKTSMSSPKSCRARDHPRACGENPVLAFPELYQPGSPPRMRGKPEASPQKAVSRGITPAHAGKTPRTLAHIRRRQDHPRACGENLSPRRLDATRKGSPPRMRGKPAHVLRAPVDPGITPAHAGKTSTFRSGKSALWDHPRACGENRSGRRKRRSQPGSPPRMRGKLLRIQHIRQRGGITPAHAGKTRVRVRALRAIWDHPRACGENTSGRPPYKNYAGSPPRMRGKLFGLQ